MKVVNIYSKFIYSSTFLDAQTSSTKNTNDKDENERQHYIPLNTPTLLNISQPQHLVKKLLILYPKSNSKK